MSAWIHKAPLNVPVVWYLIYTYKETWNIFDIHLYLLRFDELECPWRTAEQHNLWGSHSLHGVVGHHYRSTKYSTKCVWKRYQRWTLKLNKLHVLIHVYVLLLQFCFALDSDSDTCTTMSLDKTCHMVTGHVLYTHKCNNVDIPI